MRTGTLDRWQHVVDRLVDQVVAKLKGDLPLVGRPRPGCEDFVGDQVLEPTGDAGVRRRGTDQLVHGAQVEDLAEDARGAQDLSSLRW